MGTLSLSEKWRTFKTYLRRNWISSRFSRPPRDERIARKTTARNTIPAPPAPATSFWSMAMTIAASLTFCVHWKKTILTTHSSHSIAFQFRVWLSNTGYFIWIPLIEKFNQLHPSALFCFKELVHKCQSKMRKKSSEKVKSYSLMSWGLARSASDSPGLWCPAGWCEILTTNFTNIHLFVRFVHLWWGKVRHKNALCC